MSFHIQKSLQNVTASHRLAPLTSSFLAADVLMGNDVSIDFSDYLGHKDYAPPKMVLDAHAQIERQMKW